jgi:glutamyl-tRNA reductase
MNMCVLEDSMLSGHISTRRARNRAWSPRDARPVSIKAARGGRRRSSPLELVAVGLDHRTAPIELRERLAFADGDTPTALAQLTNPANPLLEQAAILSTCNRVEVYGVARSRNTDRELARFLAEYHQVELHHLTSAMYVHRGDSVAHHLAATTAGMHSIVLGEAQIQGQVRTALEHALAAGTAGPELRRLFDSAIAAGRRVRSGTAVGRGVASIPHASIDFISRRLGTLSDSTVLLIGAGITGELAAKHLAKHSPREVLVFGRDAARAECFARRHGGRSVASDQLLEALTRADVVITSTGAPHPIVSRDQLERALRRRGSADSMPLLLVDLAVPRDVEPVAGELAGVELHTIDDLRQAVEQTLVQRRAELPAAYSILRAEVARFTDWLRRREQRRGEEA